MIRENTSPATDHGPILTDRRDLVDGINTAFLIERVALPAGLDGDRLICAVTCIDDADTLAALAFASGREVKPLLATREAILAAIAPTPTKPAPPPLPGVRHAQAVVLLRRHIVEASGQGADALRIATDADGGAVLVMRDDRPAEQSRTSHRDARALIAAADALVDAGQGGEAGFVVSIAGDLHRATVEPVPDGRIIRFGRSGLDTAL